MIIAKEPERVSRQGCRNNSAQRVQNVSYLISKTVLGHKQTVKQVLISDNQLWKCEATRDMALFVHYLIWLDWKDSSTAALSLLHNTDSI